MISRPQDETKTNWNVTILVALLTLISSLGGSFLMFKSDSQNNANTNWQAFANAQIKVNEDLRNELNKVKEEVAEWKRESDSYRRLYNEEVQKRLAVEKILAVNIQESEVVRQWIDNMPYSSWAKKRRPDGDLEIIAINQRFTANYGLTKNEAIGKTDYELHPYELAAQYVADDEEVIRTGKPKLSIVPYEKTNGEVVQMRHIKWRLVWVDGSYGVAGMVIE